MLPNTIVPIQRQRQRQRPAISGSASIATLNNTIQPSSSTLFNKTAIGILCNSCTGSKKRPRTSLTPSNDTTTDTPTYNTIETILKLHPSEYAKAAFKANGFGDLEAIAKDSAARFLPPTAAMLEAYSTSIVMEVRNNNLAEVKKLFREGKFKYGVNACNRFGESILHIACRRGHLEMVKFLIGEAGLSCSEIRDDYHRTPLHDAFWTSTASPDVVEYLLEQPYVVDLLMAKDKRGFTPLDYSRGEDREKWLRFLWERRDLLKPTFSARAQYADLIENVDTISKEEYTSESPQKRQKVVG